LPDNAIKAFWVIRTGFSGEGLQQSRKLTNPAAEPAEYGCSGNKFDSWFDTFLTAPRLPCAAGSRVSNQPHTMKKLIALVLCICFFAGGVNAQQDEESGSGTGFFISGNGLIVTCAHVIEGNSKTTVKINGYQINRIQ